MAKMEQIPLLGRMRGKVGDLVIRKYRDKYVVAARPYTDKPRTEKQKAQSERFRQAMVYARHATRDPPTKELYDQAVADVDRAANTAAVSDYLRPPSIDRVDLGDYAGQAGTALTIRVENLVPVRQVAVFILESAAADEVQDPAGEDRGPAGDADEADDTAGDEAGDTKPKFTGFAEASYDRWLHARALELDLAGPTGDPWDGEWRYKTETDVQAGGADGEAKQEPGLTVVVRVTDHPGNVVEERVTLTI